jgi:hypothetical protein
MRMIRLRPVCHRFCPVLMFVFFLLGLSLIILSLVSSQVWERFRSLTGTNRLSPNYLNRAHTSYHVRVASSI